MKGEESQAQGEHGGIKEGGVDEENDKSNGSEESEHDRCAPLSKAMLDTIPECEGFRNEEGGSEEKGGGGLNGEVDEEGVKENELGEGGTTVEGGEDLLGRIDFVVCTVSHETSLQALEENFKRHETQLSQLNGED